MFRTLSLSFALAMAAAPAFAGQIGSGAVNTTVHESGRIHRVSTGSSHGYEYVKGTNVTTSLKQECAAGTGGQCSYNGGVNVYGGYGYQQGGTRAQDPYSVTTLTTQTTHFGSFNTSQSAFAETYKGNVTVNSHTVSSFGSF